MNEPKTSKQILYNAFNELHRVLSCVRKEVEASGDEEAMGLVKEMEFGLLAPMRRLRIHMNVPYDWREC